MPFSPGHILKDRYLVVSQLGQGGFGAVYRVWDTNLERPLALKENLGTTTQAQRQFKREAQILFDLSHPNLPRVIDHFTIPDKGQYLVMEFIEGEDLQEMLRRLGGPLPEAQVLEWAGQICDALSYLHSQTPPIVHRDIKPANIRIRPDGRAVLVDFGIAKVHDPQLSTTVGAQAVTPGYSPQEQYGIGATDARTDIYALGATLYNLLTGVHPPESVQRTIGASLDSPRQINPDLSARVSQAVVKAMQPVPERRYRNMAEFKAALVPSPEPDKSTPAVSRSPFLAWLRNWRGVLGVIALAVVALLFLVFGGAGKSILQPATATSLAARRISNTLPSPESTSTVAPPSATASGAAEASATLVRIIAATDTSIPPSATPAPTESPTPAAPPTQIVDDFEVPMALVPAGEFIMGSNNGKSYERPEHKVYLDGFYIDLYEVTNGDYALCVEAGSCVPPKLENSYSHSSYFRNPEYADYPVVYVGLNEAQNYCEWRDARLPTEAEWEKAARGGLEGKEYPWGDAAPVCEYGAQNGAKFIDVGCNNTDTDPVGSYSPNSYGLYDMAGNVWEWVADRYAEDYYASSPYKNPQGPERDFSSSVARGGSWANPENYSTVYRRYPLPMTVVRYFVGFRCARSLAVELATPTATPTPEQATPTSALPTQIVDERGVPMALVPAGKFMMGSEQGRKNELPLHEVHLDSFYIDVYEVTNELFAAFLNMVSEPDEPVTNWLNKDSIYMHLHQSDGKWQVDAGYENHPMTDVTFQGASAFCQWRGAVLPTEAQWEKAARGGLQGAFYPWGDEAPACVPGAKNGAQFSDCGGNALPVGSFSPNGYGLFDMAGNVWEWIADPYQYDYYSVSSLNNPLGPKFTGTWVVRGGSWNFSEDYARCAYRYSRYLLYTSPDHGFRCARLP